MKTYRLILSLVIASFIVLFVLSHFGTVVVGEYWLTWLVCIFGGYLLAQSSILFFPFSLIAYDFGSILCVSGMILSLISLTQAWLH